VRSGWFFFDDDVRANRKVAVLGGTVADGLFPDQGPVGQENRLRNVPFEIIGVLSRKGQTANGSDQDDVVLAPYTTVHIRLAIGARGSDVLTQFLVESTVMSVFDGFRPGVRPGAGAAKLLSHLTGWSTVVSPTAVILVLGFSVGVGIFFGFYPARQAASMNPIEALRYE
jgi:ABC-type antimicrobial peptide transport system permease subunit